MPRMIIRFISLLIAVIVLLQVAPALLLAREPIAGDQADSSPASLSFARLPRGCITGTPTGGGDPVCCMFGYVFFDGQAVAGATLRLKNFSNEQTVTIGTSVGPDSPLPYYQLSLSAAPLQMQPGDVVGIDVWYSSHYFYTTFTVQSGGQHLDLTIPRSDGADADFAFDRQIRPQDPAGTFAMFHGELAVDGAGLMYVADWGNARIQVFSPEGSYVRAWGDLGSAPGFMVNPSGITIDQRGTVYVSDSGSQLIYKFTPTGEWLATFGEFGTANEFRFPRDLVTDGTSLYVVNQENSRVQVLTVDGAFTDGWGTAGPGATQLQNPEGIALGPGGLLYIADTGNHRIQVFERNGTHVRSFSGPGSGDGQLSSPERVVVAPNGEVYVSDTGNHRIQVFSSTGAYLRQWGGLGLDVGQMADPGGLALDATGQVYLADTRNQRVQIFASTGAQARAPIVSVGESARLGFPTGVILGANGSIYMLDLRGQIKHFDAAGRELARFGSPGAGAGQLRDPEGFARGTDGTFYVADTGNDRIQVFSASGAYLRQIGGPGSANGQFLSPNAIAVDAANNLYVAEGGTLEKAGNHRLQKLTAQGAWLWTVGGTAAGSGNSQFDGPYGVAVSGQGVVYVADSGNNRVQTFTTSGGFIAAWAPPSGEAPFSFAADIAVGPDGHVSVADSFNYRIARFTATGNWLSTWGVPGNGPGEINQAGNLAVGPDGRIYLGERNLGRVQVLRPITTIKPVATIVSANPLVSTRGQTVSMRGLGARSVPGDGPISYAWTRSGAVTPFATTADATLETAALAPGNYTITLQVTADGQVSDPRTVNLTVLATPDTPNQLRSWTFLLYLAGDNPDITAFLDDRSNLGAIHRLINAPSNPHVTVVIQYDGDQPGDSARYILRPGAAPVRDDLAEQNMGDPQTLIDFVRWGRVQAPSDATYLAIANHGNALDGIAWDQSGGANNTERLTPAELGQAILQVSEGGTRPIDVLHLDACLMGMTEIAYEVRGLVRQLVVSENLAWSTFAYETYRATVGAATSPAALAAAIADRYRTLVSAQRLPYTISVVDMAHMAEATVRIDALAGELLRYALISPANRAQLLTVRGQVQKLDSSGDGLITAEDEYVDLDQLAELIQTTVSDSGVQSAAGQVRTALAALVPTAYRESGRINGASVDLSQARGLGIYYPEQPGVRTFVTYRNGMSFPVDTRWDEFLQAQLAALGRPIGPAPDPNPVGPLPFTRYQIHLPLLRR